MTPPDEDLHALAGEYVLGTLDADTRQAVERRRATEPALQSAVDAWHNRLLPLTQLAAPVPPSAQLWPRIQASLQALDSPAPAAAPGPARASAAAPTARRPARWSRWWNDLGLWRGLAGSGFAMAAVLAAVLVTRIAAPVATPTFMVVLVAPQDKAPGWVVQASARREIQLIPLGVAEVPADRALEFWTKA
ncbi:MAG: RNA polymerase subunit sigma-70, partial [Burkholderiaceae bacterium]|nr:RNA polymerase subunit sigma-70 [Burkholderiaceae bacterium]